MSDDSGRRRDEDDTPVDPPTGEGDVVGADWLLSQLDGEPTGQMDAIRPASHDADDAERPSADAGADEVGNTAKADRPVVAWWREKLIAAEAIVNPEARAPKDADESENDVPFVPEPAWVPPASSRHEPDPGTDPGRTFTPEYRSEDEAIEDDEAFDVPADEAETGLIPSAEPPLFKPRSAREHIIEEEAQSDYVVPASAPAPELTDDDVTADGPMTGNSSDESENETEDLDNFSWKLTPNDALDPLIHTPGSPPESQGAFSPVDAPADDATAVLPVQTPRPEDSDDADNAVDDTETGLPSRRQLRQEAEQQQAPEPVIIAPLAEPAIAPGLRRKSAVPTPAAATDGTGGSDEPPADRPARPTRPAAARAPRPVIIAAIALVAILVLGGLFFLGSQLPRLLAGPAPTETASPSPTPTETPTPTPTAPAAPVGPAAPGEQDWTALGGGECLDPYSTPWAETFTVVDCGAGHTAQMVFTAPVNADPAAAYPGEEAILAQLSLWCSAPGVLNAEAAGEYDDLQVQGTYPVTEEQWASGERNYYCFVSRSSGEQLTGSLATAQG